MKNDSILTVSFYKGTSRPYNNQDGSKGEAICIADVGLRFNALAVRKDATTAVILFSHRQE